MYKFTKEELEDLYINQKLSVKEIAEIKQCSTGTIYNYFEKFNIIICEKRLNLKNKVLPSINKEYNRWTVIEYVGQKRRLYKCKCECGTEKNIPYYDLVKGKTRQCIRCSNLPQNRKRAKYLRKLGSENSLYTGYKDLPGHYWSIYKYGARKRNLEFNISLEYAYNLLQEQQSKCNLSNLDIKLPKCNKDNWTATIDRIDSKLGYIQGNIQWLHKDINKMKYTHSLDIFLKYCDLISNHKITNSSNIEYIDKKRPGNWTGYKDISGEYWCSVKDSASKRNFILYINMEDVWNIYIKQNQKCNLTGLNIIFAYRHKDQTASVDRIDNTRGYTLDNIQILHKHINIMKNDLPQDQFINYCKLISENQKVTK